MPNVTRGTGSDLMLVPSATDGARDLPKDLPALPQDDGKLVCPLGAFCGG